MNELSTREAAIVRYALRMLLDRVSHPDEIHHVSQDDLAISKHECRLLVGRII